MIDSSVLYRYSLFDGLENDQIESLVTLMNQTVYNANCDIITEGGANDKIHFILDGRVKILKDKVCLMELEEGGVFGEMEVLEVLPVEATVRTVVPTTVMTLSIDALGRIYETDLKMYSFIIMNLARDISRRIKRINARVINESPPAEWS